MRRSLPVLVLVALAAAAAPAHADDVQDLVTGKGGAALHLRLAEAHFGRGDCAAATFHYRQVLRSATADALRRTVEARLATCRDRHGWKPPATAASERPVAWRPLTIASGPVVVPAGPFLGGTPAAERALAAGLCAEVTPSRRAACTAAIAAEPDVTTVALAAFRIDRREVTWSEWSGCVRAGRCSRLAGAPGASGDGLPVTGVSHGEASTFCRWRGGRLPTEREWEKAARGPEVPPRPFPWGSARIPGCARLADDGPAAPPTAPAAAGSSPCDASTAGVFDLGGNVREWVDGGRSGPGTVKGGSYRTPWWRARVAQGETEPATHRAPDLGFRCAYDSPPGTQRVVTGVPR